jgi:transcriptional regulator with XRE-family HTH domain
MGYCAMSGGFGERLKEERKRTGLNQSDFAKLGGVHRNSQTEYETGKTAPNADYLIAIAGGGVDVSYLLTGVRAAGAMTEAESALVANIRRLPAQPRDNILALVASLVNGALSNR